MPFTATPVARPPAHWFQQLNQRLRHSGQGVPTLVLDQAALTANIHFIQQQLPCDVQPRLVVKSLTCMPLLAHLVDALQCQRFMVFHAPHLPRIIAHFADADILLGKPMPVAAARHFYQQSATHRTARIQWLIDSHERLAQYLQLAGELGQALQVSIEIDIGLGRGGVQTLPQLAALLGRIAAHPESLRLSGLMGYDAHVGKIPTMIQSLQATYRQSQQQYQACIELIRQQFPSLWREGLCFNGAGSPTFNLHCQQTVCNDLAFGSMLLKPADFDLASLAALQPALFIATPVLKVLPHSQIPGLAMLDQMLHILPKTLVKRHQALFIYGGNWQACYVYPQGARTNALYGRSSNQEMLNVPSSCGINMDDHVFLRPTQSEAVMGQFPTLYRYDGQQLEGWPTFND